MKLFIFQKKIIFCFYGNLGAGKTTLIKLIVSNYKYSTIFHHLHIQLSTNTKQKIAISFIIFICIDSNALDEAMNIGIEDYLYSNHLCFIEWPDNFRSYFT